MKTISTSQPTLSPTEDQVIEAIIAETDIRKLAETEIGNTFHDEYCGMFESITKCFNSSNV